MTPRKRVPLPNMEGDPDYTETMLPVPMLPTPLGSHVLYNGYLAHVVAVEREFYTLLVSKPSGTNYITVVSQDQFSTL